jgi:RHS repeat-associated protein
VTSGTGPSPQGYLVAANNALTGNGLTYDLHDGTGAPRGNVINDGSNSYMYDAEGRLYSVDGTTCYTYDGDGDLVAKTNCNVVNAGNGGTTGITAEFLYDTNHRLMARVDVSTELTTAANIYAGGQLIAEDLPDPFVTTPTATLLRVTDQVGTLRGLLDLGEHQVESCTSFPYGDGVTCSSAADKQFFTGKWRLPESQLDYFGARYYNSTLGRFTSPDYQDLSDALPFVGIDPIPYADTSNPQSFNLYSYVGNNPISRTDSDGHDVKVCDNNGQCNTISNDAYTAAQKGNNGGLNVPTLDQVGTNGNGSGQFNSTAITNSNGDTVGSATYVSNGGADYYANANGFNQLANTSQVVKAGTAIYAGVYGSVIAGVVAAEPIADALAAQRYQAALKAWEAYKGTGAAKLLSEFFKTGALPAGLTKEAAAAYLALAKAYVDAGRGGIEGLAVQSIRIQQLEQFLGK